MAEKPVWAGYTVHNEMGQVIGIRDDAPEYVKQAYAEYLKELKEYAERGKFIPR